MRISWYFGRTLNVSTFRIEFEPRLPKAETKTTSLSLDHLDVGRILTGHTQEYDVRYRIDQKTIGYYPASIITVLNDMYEEWTLARSRTSHTMTLSGYPVLQVEYDGETALFLDLVQFLKYGIRKPIADPISALDVEAAFRSALEHILSVTNYYGSQGD